MPYPLSIDLILNSNEVLALFRQKQIARYNRTKTCKNRIMTISLFSYLMFGYILLINSLHPCLQKKVLTNPFIKIFTPNQTLVLITHGFIGIAPKNTTHVVLHPKIYHTTIIRGLCRFLQPGLISSMTFEEKLALSNVNHKILSNVKPSFLDLKHPPFHHISFKNFLLQK